MNKKHANWYDMFLRVSKVLTIHTETWQHNTSLMANYTALTAQIEAINKLESKRDINKAGTSRQKAALKEKLIGQMIRVIKGLHSYAADHHLLTLSANIDYNKSSLQRSRETLLPVICERIHAEVQPHVARLTDYGISSALLTGLQDTSEAFKKIQPENQLMISDGKNTNTMLDNLFAETNDLLRIRIDGKMEQFKDDKPEFYNAYFNARNILDRRRSAKAEEKAV